MPTNSEKYGYDNMSNDELEERIAADLLELSERFVKEDAKIIGSLLWRLMRQVRETYRTGRLIVEGR